MTKNITKSLYGSDIDGPLRPTVHGNKISHNLQRPGY